MWFHSRIFGLNPATERRAQGRSVSLALLLMVTMLLAGTSGAMAEELTIDSAINKAGMQRMLIQRITKSYLLIGHDVAAGKALKQLDASVALFEEHLGELENYSPTADITASLNDIRREWNSFRESAFTPPERHQAVAMIEEGARLLELCEKNVRLLEAYSGNRKGELINLSGRQRMLSQRIAMLYIAKSWRVPHENLDAAFDQAMNDFDQALTRLLDSPLNTDEINEALDEVSAQWEFSRSGFDLGDNGHYVPFVIQTTTESILHKMDAITTLYTATRPRES